MSPLVRGRGANPRTTHDNAGIAAWNFKMVHEVRSWDQAAALLAEHGPNLMIGPQMKLVQGVQGMRAYHAVKLYETEIIRFYLDNTFSVDNGGFNTLTTTERLQAVLPEGFRCFHFSTDEVKGKLGLIGHQASAFPKRRKVQEPSTLWPLDHNVRITMTGEKVSA